jgi:hypothetical protein
MSSNAQGFLKIFNNKKNGQDPFAYYAPCPENI